MHELPPLIELRAFEAAARHLNFMKAAAELGVTPTAISHQIRLLERYCGHPLFRRRPRPLSLTAEGSRLFPVVRDGLAAFAAAIGDVRKDAARQPLRITTTNAFASRWLVPRLPGWRQLHPQAPLDVIGTDSVLDLNSGEADIAIRYARAAPAGAVATEILSDTFYPMCSPTLRASGFRQVSDLRGQVLVHCYWPASDLEAPTWARWLAMAGERWPRVPVPGDLEHLSFREELHAMEAVIAGQGIGIFSDVLAASELASGRLVKAFGIGLPGYRFFVVAKADDVRGKLIGAFVSWLHQVK